MRVVRRRYVNRPAVVSELQADLLAVFKLDDISSVTDEVSNIITLSPVNPAGLSQVPGINGNAIRTVPTSAFGDVSYYQAPGTLDLTSRSFSVFAWAKMTNNGGTVVIDNQNLLIGSWKAPASHIFGNIGEIEWALELYRFVNGTYALRVWFNDTVYAGLAVPVDGNWNLYGFSYDVVLQELSIYYSNNGVMTRVPINWTPIVPPATLLPGATMYVGGGVKIVGNKFFTHYDVSQDESYIWLNRALTDANVATLYRNGLGRFYPGFYPV